MKYIKLKGNPNCKMCDIDIKTPYDSPIIRLIFPSFPYIPQLLCIECGYHTYYEFIEEEENTVEPPARPVGMEEKENEV